MSNNLHIANEFSDPGGQQFQYLVTTAVIPLPTAQLVGQTQFILDVKLRARPVTKVNFCTLLHLLRCPSQLLRNNIFFLRRRCEQFSRGATGQPRHSQRSPLSHTIWRELYG